METPKERTRELYNHMANEHELTLLDDELNQIEIIVDRMLANDRADEPALRSSSELAPASWLDALAERFERRASHIYRSRGYCTEEQRQAMTAIFDGIAEELRAEAESASNQQLDEKTD